MEYLYGSTFSIISRKKYFIPPEGLKANINIQKRIQREKTKRYCSNVMLPEDYADKHFLTEDINIYFFTEENEFRTQIQHPRTILTKLNGKKNF